MALTEDVEEVGLLVVLLVLLGAFLSTFMGKVKEMLPTGGSSAGQKLGESAGTVFTGAIQGAGGSLGDWLWNGMATLFPSLFTVAPFRAKTIDQATYEGTLQTAPINPNASSDPSKWTISDFTLPTYPDYAVDPSKW